MRGDRGKNGWQERTRKTTHRNVKQVTGEGHVWKYEKKGRRSDRMERLDAMDLPDGRTLTRVSVACCSEVKY